MNHNNSYKFLFFNLKIKKGFTLLEMLVVIGIVAVLVSMGFVSYSTAQKKARDAKRKLEMNNIRNAMEQYYSICNGVYPVSDGGVVPGSIITTTPECSTDLTIMDPVPVDPKVAVSYDYDDTSTPPRICATTDGFGTNLMESEGDPSTPYCVYLQQ